MHRLLALALLLVVPPLRAQVPGFEDLAGGPGATLREDVVSGVATATEPVEDIHDLHRVMIDNDGALRTRGSEQTTPESLRALFREHIPQFFETQGRAELVIHAHGGTVSQEDGLAKISTFRSLLEAEGVYPLLFVWRSGIWESIENSVEDAWKGGGAKGYQAGKPTTKSFAATDWLIEKAARHGGVRALWSEMKENALLASEREDGAASLVVGELARLKQRFPDMKLHLSCHSAGSVLLAPFIERLHAVKVPVSTLLLQSPACTVDLFKKKVVPVIRAEGVGRTILFNLKDEAEKDDSVGFIYRKSILYMIRNALEDEVPTPILGLDNSFQADADLKSLAEKGRIEVVLTPNDFPINSPYASFAADHVEQGDELALILAASRVILADR